MWHGKGYKKLNRTSAHRKALLRNMATSLIQREYFETTIEKAKSLKPVVEKLITAAKKGTLASRKKAASYLKCESAVEKLFTVIADRFKTRPGGYTRIVRTGYRHGDAANKAVIALVDAKPLPRKKKVSKTEATGEALQAA
jgi:large subunit ribosomal protein L17